jgi:hypothetical protein
VTIRASTSRRSSLPVSVRGRSSQISIRSGAFALRRRARTNSCSSCGPMEFGDDGGIGYVFVTQQHLLDVGRRYIFAAANDRVIGASAESISPCSVLIQQCNRSNQRPEAYCITTLEFPESASRSQVRTCLSALTQYDRIRQIGACNPRDRRPSSCSSIRRSGRA